MNTQTMNLQDCTYIANCTYIAKGRTRDRMLFIDRTMERIRRSDTSQPLLTAAVLLLPPLLHCCD